MKDKIQSVVKALKTLEILNKYSKGLGVNELAKLTLMPSSTAHRMLSTLEVEGYVYQDKVSDKYRLSHKLLYFCEQIAEDFGLVEVALSELEQLAQSVRENIALGILEGTEVLHIHRIASSEALRADIRDFRLPAACTAIGKFLMAHMPEEQLLRSFPEKFLPKTTHTITSMNELLEELQTIRGCKYAIDNEETYDGVRCIATGIWDYRKDMIAGISITAPAYRFTDDKIPLYSAALQEAAARISNKIKYSKNIASTLKGR